MRSRRLAWIIGLSAVAGLVPILVGAQDAGTAPGTGNPIAGGPAQGSAQAAAMQTPNAACIPAELTKSLTACPANAPRAAKNAGSAPSEHLQTADKVQKEKKQAATGPTYALSAELAQNRAAVQARSEQLLRGEIQITERLVRNTRTQDPRRPDILLRLAEDYFELQQTLTAAVRAFDDPIFRACTQQKNASACSQQRQQQTQAETALTGAREAAIRTYATLVQDHPNYRRMDEVLFSLGYALEEMRQFDRARQVYYRLIKGFPQSKFVPNAYLSFAEYYFNQQQDMASALQFYQKVCEIPPEHNPVYGYALYKQAWVYYNQEDFRSALQKFVEVIEFAAANPDARDVQNLVRQARHELVLPYAQVGSPQRALDFFRRYAENEQGAFDMFEQLGDLYFDTGQWPNAISVFHDLMRTQPTSDKLCYWQSKVTNAIISSRPKPEQVTEIQRLIDMYDHYTGAGQHHPQARVDECKQATASVLVELSTAWHREAIGTDAQPGTNDRNTMNLASQLYRLVLDKFPDMESMQFPDIDHRDWPTNYRVSYFYAELLWKMEDWQNCGPAFDKVVELNPGGEFTADAAYAAVLCYNNLYQQSYAGHEHDTRTQVGVRDDAGGGAHGAAAAHGGHGGHGRGHGAATEAAPTDPNAEFAAHEFTPQQTGMLNAFQRFVCFVPDSDELPTVKYRRARIYYEANHYEEAALIFRDIAMNHRDTDVAEYAANLYLDCLNILGTHTVPARPSCFNAMETDTNSFLGFYCGTPELTAAHPDLCTTGHTLICDIKRKECEAMATNRDFDHAARCEVALIRTCANDQQTAARIDEVFYNAAIHYEAAHLLGRAIRVRKALIQRFPDSEWSKRALYLVGANYHALAIYSNAADYYEQFATRFPGENGAHCTDADRAAGTCPNAVEALQNAVFFRLGLGDPDKAVDDAHLFERNYGPRASGANRRMQDTANVIFSLGTIYENQHDWTHVVSHYHDWLHTFGRTALPNQIISANMKMAHAYREAHQPQNAAPIYVTVLRLWGSDGAHVIAGINGADGATDEQKALNLLDAKTGVSEALFYQAEVLYEEYNHIHFPEYRGQGDLASVNTWASHSFVEWLTRKKTALDTAEAAYNKIVPLDVPQWLISAASRIGSMYTEFVDAFDDAPVPTEIANDPDLYQVYVGALEEQRQIFFNLAIPKFEFCLITSTRVRWFNDYSRTCESELHRLNPTDYPLADELRGEPGYVYRAPAVPGAVDLGQQAEAAEAGDSEATGTTSGGGDQ